MNLSKLLLYIGLAIIGFWVLGFLLKLTAAILDIALIVGLVLVVIWLVNEYITKKNNTP